MSAVSLSYQKEKPTESSPDDGYRKEGDEQRGSACDPAVLALGPARRPLTYTRDDLLRLRESPIVKKNIENAFVGCDALMSSRACKKRSDSPNEEDRGAKGDAPNENHKGVYSRDRRSADPRERVRKESEPSAGGIVLSPQRRSFTSGCGAPAAPAAPLAPLAPHVPRREEPVSAPHTTTEQGGRRIGSGRIMVRDVPPPAWEEPDFRAEPYQNHARTNGDRFERRSFNRDSFSSDMKRERDDRFNNEKPREREDNRRSGGRYSQRRFEKEVEPEWFSGGPTSKLETIELRGFDEPAKKNGTVSTKDNNEKRSSKSNSGSKSPERWREQAAPPAPPSRENENSSSETKKEEVQNNEQPDFNLDEFLKFDAIPDVLTNGGNESEGSRFSRWFRRESPNSDKHYDQLLRNIVDDLESPPAAGKQGFVPIAPAAPSLLDLLRRANAHTEDQQDGGAGGKIHSLEELEARLRPQPPPPPPPHAGPENDLSAFKRLLAQVSGGHAVPAERPQQPPPPPQQPPPMSLLQMLNKSMEQQQQHKAQQQQQQQQAPHIPQELLIKLLHVQQSQRQPAGDVGPAPPVPPAPPAARELLQRPEAQAIIHGLKAGEITVQHLVQQLGNPGLQSRHREVLLTILRLHQQRQQMCASPAGLLAPPPPPLRLSPLPHPGVPGRIPSPRELAAHTQSIMQSALIKKKLEEQRENYRRRHEAQPKQSTPISFTPTSVLRKMTAEKECDAPSPKPQQQPWLQSHKMPQGRPIVKGNQGGSGPPMGYAPSQADYQQHFMNQQQQQLSANARPFPHQQRQPQNPNAYNSMGMGAMSRAPAGPTLHQLLVQSHQRTLNEMAGASSGGGDNQLARWFSPELLARASAGKLPSVHVPNALSLEDLERHHHSPAPAVRN